MNEREVRAVENLARTGISYDDLRKAFPEFSIEYSQDGPVFCEKAGGQDTCILRAGSQPDKRNGWIPLHRCTKNTI